MASSEWRKRVEALGLNPDRDANGFEVIVTTNSLEEYKRWFDIPQPPNVATSTLTPARVAKSPPALLQRHITDYITGESAILDAEVIEALDQRVGYYFAHVSAQAKRIVTKEDPLLITSNTAIREFDEIEIRDGGYIKITVPCSFHCNVLTKTFSSKASSVAGQADQMYDVLVVGRSGAHAKDGNSPQPPAEARAGDGAKCDCPNGGFIGHPASNGSPGIDGGKGGDATAPGEDGEDAPIVFFTVAKDLPKSISFLMQGGNGGTGGDGGNGAKGGKGGAGGAGIKCGVHFAQGALGGRGGKGGNGGNGSKGGDGGDGGKLTILVPDHQKGNVIVTVGAAPGGAKGNRGIRGKGGDGGNAGPNGGQPGENGPPGDSDGQDYQPGKPGEKGSATVNGVPVD